MNIITDILFSVAWVYHANLKNLKRKSSSIWKDTAENWWAQMWHFVTQVNMIMMVSLGKTIMWQFHRWRNTSATDLNVEHLDSKMFTSFRHTKTSANQYLLNNNFERYWVVIEQRPHIIIAGGGGSNLPLSIC